jgi:RimJ/RimL family protein N-acetyltransferase
VALRPVRSADALLVAGALTDEIARWVGLGSADEMRAGTPEWAASAGELAARGEAFRYLVYYRRRFSGTIEVRPDSVRGHVGYWLRRLERGRGTATRSVRLVLPIAFEGLGLPAVDFVADAANAPSIAVMERVGAVCVARYETPDASGGDSEVRYRIRRRGYRPSADGPRRLHDLLPLV